MKKKFKNSKQISKLNINLRLFLDFSFPLLLFFYYSLENCENLSFEYFQSFYNGQLVNWKIQKAIPFSYENMSIYHNTSVAIANRTIDSKYVLNSGWLKAKVYCPSDCHLISNSTYTIIPDTIVSKFAGFGSLSQYVDVNHPPDYKRFRVASETGTIVGSCDNLIAIGHMWVFVFGHFVLDVLPSMLFIPENVRNTSKLLLTINSTMYKEYYYAMGFRDDQFVFIENDQFLYVQQLHTVINKQPIHGNMVNGIKEIGPIVKKYYKVENIKPFYLGLQNRKEGLSRHLTNFDEIISECEKRYGKENILILPDAHKSLYDAVLAFSSLRIFFGPTGSGFTNMIFMEEECGIVMAMGNWINGTFTALAYVLHIWCVTFNVAKMSHWNKARIGPVNLTRLFLSIDTVDYAIKNKKWGVEKLDLMP